MSIDKVEDFKILDHFIELKKRIIYSLIFALASFFLCYSFSEEIFKLLIDPLIKINNWHDKKIIYTNLTEAFFSYIKLSLFASSFISLPYFIIQIYIFVAPGLYKDEKIILLPYFISVPLLFLLGSFFVYYYIFPLAWKFFLSFEISNMSDFKVQLEPKISEYISLAIHLILAFGVAFQLPVFLILLIHVNIITVDYLIQVRRFAIIIIFILAAIITPPDAISQISLAIPMILLYEVAIFVGKFIQKKRLNYA